jgi:hypothetical protein
MAKVLKTNLRFVRVAKKGTGDNPDELERVRMLAGEKVSDLPKEVQKQLDEEGLLVDEKRWHPEGYVIPPGYPDSMVDSMEETVTQSRVESQEK